MSLLCPWNINIIYYYKLCVHIYVLSIPLHIKHHQIQYVGTQQNEIHYCPRYISFEIFCNCYYCPRATETRRSDQFGDVHQVVCMEKNLD